MTGAGIACISVALVAAIVLGVALLDGVRVDSAFLVALAGIVVVLSFGVLLLFQ